MIMLGTYGERALTYMRRLMDDADPQIRQNARLALLALAEATDLRITFLPFRGIYAQCLGRLRVYVDSYEIEAKDWAQADHGRVGGQRVQSAFAYLVHCGRRGTSRAALGTAVWGGSYSPHSLSRTLTTLRQTLIKAGGPTLAERALMISHEHCILDPTYYHTDMQLFEHTFAAAVRVEQESGLALAAPIYSQALHLYSGPYMADIPRGSGWSQQRRDQLTSSFMLAAERVAAHAYSQREYKQCINICMSALDINEAAAEIVVWLMRAYNQEGLYTDLEQTYRRYARALELDLDDRADCQNPVVQIYQSLSRTHVVNNSCP